MKTDKTCQTGQEHFEDFQVRCGRTNVVKLQYDFRTETGDLFSGIFDTLSQARATCELWKLNLTPGAANKDQKLLLHHG